MEDELMLQIPNSFPYINIMQGARGHSEKGPLEIVSEELISSAAKGDASTVEKLLKQRDVHPDVADRNGYTAVLAAAVSNLFVKYCAKYYFCLYDCHKLSSSFIKIILSTNGYTI